MKKYCFSLLAAVAMLFAVSCSQDDELVSASGSDEQNVTFSVQLPGAAQTRAVADGVEVGGGNMANTLICALYEQGKTSETPLVLKEITERDDRVFDLSLPMAKGLTYEILFMAYNKDNCAFNVNFTEGDLTSVNLQALTLKSELKANQEAYDVFVGHITHKVNAEAVTLVKLNRPFAQVNAATTLADLQNAETLKAVVTASELEIKKVPTTYNVLTGEATAEATLTYKAADILKAHPATTPVNEKINVEGNDYYYLAMAYVLAGNGANDKSLHDATFKFNRADGTTVSTVILANMPIQRNYRTNVVGELLTHAEDFKVVVDEVFKEPASEVSYWDGKTVKEPAVENGAYIIRSAAEFAWLEAPRTLEYDIELAGDINMGGYTFKGILSNGKALDGKGHTLSNIILDYTTEGQDWSSLFVTGGGNGNNSKISVKNLTVDGANVVADESDNGNAAVIASYVENTANIENVVVKNSKVNGTLNMGALVGIVTASGNASIKDCAVENTILTTFNVENESGNVGMVAGRVVGKLTIENTPVSGSTVNAYINRTGSQRAVSKYIGNFYGENANLVVTNATVNDVTVNVLNEENKSEACQYGDFLGGWQKEGGTVIINGVNIEKGESPFVTTAEELATALSNAQDGDVIGIGASIATKSLNASGKSVTLVGMTENAGIDASTSGFSTWSENITAKNLTIKFHSTIDYYHTGINCSGNITFDDCDFEGIATAMNGNFVYNRCTFVNAEKGKYAAWVYSGAATYEECTFTGVDRAVKVYTEAGNSATATYTDCTFNSTEANKAAVEIDATNNNGKDVYYTVNINNATVNGMAKGEFTGNVHCNIEGTNANVYVDGVKVVRAILIGNTAYASLGDAIAAAKDGDEIVLADGTYEGLFSCNRNIVLNAATGATPVIDGMLFVSDGTVKAKGLTFTDVHEQTLTYGLHTKVNNSCVGIYAGTVELDNCVFEITGKDNYGVQSYSGVNLKVEGCTFNCNGQRPIANNGPSTVVTGCTFNNQYQYALRIKENNGDKQTVVFENNTIVGETAKTPIEGINISKLGSTATILGNFTIKGNTEGLAYRHHSAVTMSADCKYDTDIENFGFVSE